MRVHPPVKDKGPVPVMPPALSPEPVAQTMVAPLETPSVPTPDPEAYLLRYRHLQEEAEAREKKLVAELEEKHEALFRRLEASFAERERRLSEELTSKHMAEYRRLELAAADREHLLLEKLGVARRFLTVVVIGFVLLVAVVMSERLGLGVTSQPVLPPEPSGESTAPKVVDALLPHLAAPEVALTKPTLKSVGTGSLKEAQAVKTAGNHGIFARGTSTGKL